MRVTFGNFVSATRVGFRVAREDEGFENRRRVGFRVEELRWILGRERRRRFWEDEKNGISGRGRGVGFRITTRSGIWGEIKIQILGPTRRAGFRVLFGKGWGSGAGQVPKKTVCDGPASGDTPGFESARRTRGEETMRRAPQEQKTKGEAQPKSSWPAPAATTRATRTPNPQSKRQYHPRM